ncbi:MAG: hypothetical protein NDJ94_24375 [Vicinamibacteria bacterium]|nr:hypothetical protein [Vicinamibacteria bacterium]
MSLARELEGLRSETRLLREHVRSLARGIGSGGAGPVETSPRLAGWRESQPRWLLAVAALTGGTAATIAALAAAPWAGTAVAAALGGALPILVRVAGGFRRRR